ncbi:hypothetical protein GCM10027160_38850 [Streptomyces calidiresistens]|uniref:Uncharacterized protein n=1 Tax=Streptomyces calidiresistens TaxID=1485586 RepID=A0A7W3T0R0_9ACTN|nr:hypothetical protein [Streptomyces calidiresistens]MBB0228775.1 hypothetical protein [Streptomyces calidiresistens]
MGDRFETAFTGVLDRMDEMPWIGIKMAAYMTAPFHFGTTGYVLFGVMFLLEGIATVHYRRIRKRKQERDNRETSSGER